MALWIIAYGVVQASAPKLLGAKSKPLGQISRMAWRWVAGLTVIPLALAGLSLLADGPQGWLTAALIAGLMVFGFVFAVNSSLHSYLILSFTDAKRVTMDVGFYYMANAAGRLVGTLLSGLTYQIGGLPLCLGTAAVMIGLSAASMTQLRATAP